MKKDCNCPKENENTADATVPVSDLKHHDFPGADPYYTLMQMGRLRATRHFNEKYGRDPDWPRTIVTVQNSVRRVSVHIREEQPTGTYMAEQAFTPPPRGSGDGRTRGLRSTRQGDRRPNRQVGALREESQVPRGTASQSSSGEAAPRRHKGRRRAPR